MDDIQQQVNEEEIATFYNKVEEIWPSNEPWYKYTKAQIEKFVHKMHLNIMIMFKCGFWRI